MSCIDHVCRDCGAEWFDNRPSRDPCPECGSDNTWRIFDEQTEVE